MSDEYQRIEVITGAARRRRWTTEEKPRIVDATLRSGDVRRSGGYRVASGLHGRAAPEGGDKRLAVD